MADSPASSSSPSSTSSSSRSSSPQAPPHSAAADGGDRPDGSRPGKSSTSAPPTDRQRQADLMPAIYDELRHLAARYLRRRHGVETLQPTAVVHEAYLKLLERQTIDQASRTHYFALAAQAMRWVIADYARMRHADKRGGAWRQVTLDEAGGDCAESTEVDLVALDDALERLAKQDERAAQVVQLRFFAGLSIEETATALGVSPGTVKNEWRWARAWLLDEFKQDTDDVGK